jgi:hypothetical protein
MAQAETVASEPSHVLDTRGPGAKSPLGAHGLRKDHNWDRAQQPDPRLLVFMAWDGEVLVLWHQEVDLNSQWRKHWLCHARWVESSHPNLPTDPECLVSLVGRDRAGKTLPRGKKSDSEIRAGFESRHQRLLAVWSHMSYSVSWNLSIPFHKMGSRPCLTSSWSR